jgi:regulator of protease activity HflC (stomatin/prohibitin superfamily)
MVGKNYKDTIIEPAIQEAVKAVTAKYTAENLIVKRDNVSQSINKTLKSKLNDYGISIKSVNIKNFDFSDRFTNAVESKQEAEQLALKSKQDLERIKTEAEQKIETAKAEAESLRIQKEQITSELIELRKVENQSKAIQK